MGSKKAKLFEPEPKLVKPPARFDHVGIDGTSSGTATNVSLVLIIHPTSTTHMSSSSAPAMGTSEASANH